MILALASMPWPAMPLAVVGVSVARAEEPACKKEQFEAVVEEAATALRSLNQKNKPPFQEKLRRLKEKRGWTHDQFLSEAAPYVRDEKIESYDKATEELLSTIAMMGQEGANAETPDCARLTQLNERMSVLVGTQTAKWNYMFDKLDQALAK